MIYTRLLLLVFTWTLPVAAFAQSSIVGTVVDQTGAAIPDARVIAVQAATTATRETGTDESGHFQISNLPIGVYTIRYEKQDFQTVELQDVSLSINQTLEEHITMRIASASQTVDVREQPEALATTATTASVALGGERIDDNPTQNRNYLNFVLLAPGVAPAANSNALRRTAGLRSPDEDSGFTFGGMRARNNGLYIDGLDNRDEMTGGNRVAVSLDMVQEFQVSGSDIAPELGGAAGGNVNVVTLSGTNQWHGDASLFLENEFANARDPDVESPTTPRFRRYQPEASIAGPLRKDRTFLSATVEQEWESTQDSSEIGEGEALSQINTALAGPGFARSAVHQITESLFPTDSSSTLFALKLNHQLNPPNALFARYAYSSGSVSHEVLGTNNFSDQSARGSSSTRDQSVAAGWAAVPNRTFISALHVQFAHRSVDFTPNSRSAFIEIPGVVSFGQSSQLDGATSQNYYQAVEALTFVRGSHQLGVGVSGQYISFNNRLPNRFAGIYIFPTLADFSRAAPDVFIQRFGDPHRQSSTVPLGIWLQDQWQPGAGVTIVAGIRYDAQKLPKPIPSETNNWSPRFGIAWHPGTSAWVLRGSFGLFYDRYPFAFLSDAIQMDGIHGFEQYAAGGTAARAFALAQGGALNAPLDGVAHSIYRPDTHFPSTYARHITAGVERSFGPDTTLTVEYLNVHGFHLPRIRNINGTLPPLYQLEQTSSSTYQGLSIALNRRLSHELTYLISYTESRAWDDASDFDEQPLNPNHTRLDWARSRQYQAHRLVASGIFELPFGDMLAAPVWLRRLSHEFEFGPIVSVGSPRPINALESTDLFRTGAYPISARRLDLARNPFFDRWTISADLRVSKGFVLAKDRGLLSVGVDGYNLTNHTNSLRVSPYYSDGENMIPSYKGLVETQGARQFQFTIEWEF
jgi:hypothetical protein